MQADMSDTNLDPFVHYYACRYAGHLLLFIEQVVLHVSATGERLEIESFANPSFLPGDAHQ
jgi:hypothetical protein